jgi:hypothetical protein
MRLKADLHHVNVGKDHFIIDPDGGAIDLTDLYAMNEAAAYLWEQFSNRDFTPEEMARELAASYDVSHEQALTDVRQLLQTWNEYGLIV